MCALKSPSFSCHKCYKLPHLWPLQGIDIALQVAVVGCEVGISRPVVGPGPDGRRQEEQQQPPHLLRPGYLLRLKGYYYLLEKDERQLIMYTN